MAGLTVAGLNIKTLPELIADVNDALRAALGTAIQLGTGTVFGQLRDSFLVQLDIVWQLARQVYDAFDPDVAEGEQLDNLAGLVAVTRLPATFSSVTPTLGGIAGTVVPAGSVARIGLTGARWVTDADATIGIGGTVDVLAFAEDSGPIEGAAGTIDTIATAIAGWATVTNTEDAEAGRDVETDIQLRARRSRSLQIIGAGTDSAIRAQLGQVTGVLAVRVISNRTLITDAFGIPGKAFRAVIHPATVDPELIAPVIFNTQPAGILSDGSELVEVTDSQGFINDIRFSFATVLDMFARATLTVDDAEWPSDGGTQVVQAILDFGDTLSVGDDVIVVQFACAILEVQGVVDVVFRVKEGSFPLDLDVVNLTVDAIEIADFDSSRIIVVVL